MLLKKAYTKGNPRKTACDFCPVKTSGKSLCPAPSTSGLDLAGCIFLSGEQSRIPAVSGKSKQMKQMTNHFLKTWSKIGLAAGEAVGANFPEYLQNHL